MPLPLAGEHALPSVSRQTDKRERNGNSCRLQDKPSYCVVHGGNRCAEWHSAPKAQTLLSCCPYKHVNPLFS